MTVEFRYPRGVRLRLKMKLDQTEQGKQVPGASRQFLDAMPPILHHAKSRNDKQTFITPGKRKDLLIQCHDKFCNLLEFVSDLPEHVRLDINNGIYELGLMNLEKITRLEANESNLNDQEIEELRACKLQADSKPLDFDDLENLLSKVSSASHLKYKSIDIRVEKVVNLFDRHMFLRDMVCEYQKAYGEDPDHTYSRKGEPKESKAKGFHGVAYEMCELVGFLPTGIEKVLTAIIGIKPPRPIEEVRAEMAARSVKQSTDT